MTSVQGDNIPNKDVIVSTPGKREIIPLDGARLEVLEDGSNTDQRIGAMQITIPAHSSGPPQHWQYALTLTFKANNPLTLHDETFLVTAGEITFTSRDKTLTLKAGEFLVVPPMAPHTFANNSDAEASMFNTFTPAYYVNYFRVMAKMVKENGGKMTPEIAKNSMMRYATLPTKMMGYEW